MLQRTATITMLACVFSTTAAAQAADAPLMASIFADHAVLQRNRPIEIWGRAQPGEQVTVSLSNSDRNTQADAQGKWAVSLPSFPAGGPHVLSARTSTRRQVVSDVLVGDVWLCSGQSNMEWAVRNTINADSEVQHSANKTIRHVTIARAVASVPDADFRNPIEWKVAGPTTTEHFSAVCYYFARELQKTTRVPQGLINSSWGGTRIETWLSDAALRQLGGNDAKLSLLAEYGRDAGSASARWGGEWETWWKSQAVTQGIDPWAAGRSPTGEWKAAPAQLTQWENWGVPELAAYDGMMWYRARVKLSAAQAKKAASVALEVIDDVDLVWINGQPIGSGEGENARVYRIPPKLLKAGENVVVVNVFDMWGSGGMHGNGAARVIRFDDGSTAPLGGWE